jgi:hypothetical protein
MRRLRWSQNWGEMLNYLVSQEVSDYILYEECQLSPFYISFTSRTFLSEQKKCLPLQNVQAWNVLETFWYPRNVHPRGSSEGSLLYRQESILATRRLHQTQNNFVKYYVLQFARKIWNFYKCAGSAWWPIVSAVTIRFCITWLVLGEKRAPPPPAGIGTG